MKSTELIHKVEKSLRDHSPAILTALGVSGTLSTAYLAAKASVAAAEEIRQAEEAGILGASLGYKRERLKARVKYTWKLYIPAAVSGAVTIGCIITGAKIGTKRAAAAYSLLTVSEQAFVEYKEKVVEQIGEKKEQKLRDELAQDRVDRNQSVIIAGSGSVVCFEQHTGRKFMCDMETLRKAENRINSKCIREMYANLGDFYHLVGLPDTSNSSYSGWTSDQLMELRISAVMSDGQPCLSFDYNYLKPL